MSAVLKLSYQGEVRRVLLKEDQELSYEKICQVIAEAWPALQDYTPKYVDEDGDLCILSHASFSDFLAISRASSAARNTSGQLLLRLEIVPASSQVNAETRAGQDPGTPMESLFSSDKASDAGHQHSQDWSGGTWHQHAENGQNHWSHHGNPWRQHAHDWLHQALHRAHHYAQHHQHHDWFQKCARKWGECKGNGKGKRWCQSEGHEFVFRTKKMLWLMSQLHASDALTESTAVSLWVSMLPKAVQLVASDQTRAGSKFREKLPNIKQVLQHVLEAVKSCDELDHCEGIIMHLLSSGEEDLGDDAAVGELLLGLLTAICALGFDKQVEFFGTFYKLHKEKLIEILDTWSSWCWKLPMDHHGVMCDGCGQNPLPGLRFKSTTCDDCDLCSECFLKKESLQDGKFAGQEFNLIPIDWANMWWKKQNLGMPQEWGAHKHAWKMWMHGNGEEGKGKGKGKCRGKGKGKRTASDAGMDDMEVDAESKSKCARQSDDGDVLNTASKCANPDCNFQRTWHVTHCCAACAIKGEHGGRCEKKPFSEAQTTTLQNSAETLEEMGVGPASDMESVLTKCASPDCNFQRTWHETHCCVACAIKGEHGGRCEKKPFSEAQTTTLQNSAETLKEMCVGPASDMESVLTKCASPDCNFQRTWHETHCCVACAIKGEHGGRCEKKPFKETHVKNVQNSAKTLEEMGFGPAPDMELVLKECGGDLTKALEKLAI